MENNAINFDSSKIFLVAWVLAVLCLSGCASSTTKLGVSTSEFLEGIVSGGKDRPRDTTKIVYEEVPSNSQPSEDTINVNVDDIAFERDLYLNESLVKSSHPHALVIGIDNYPRLPDLQTAVSDARSVASVLEELYGFKVELLLDATRKEILRALRRFRILEFNEPLLIYYAGHGWLDKEADEGYWLPRDADRNDIVNWIPNSVVTAEVRAIKANHVMIVADSCYSGKLTRGLNITGPRSADYYRRLSERRARVVLTSGGLEPVMDDGGVGLHSVFASAFLDILEANEGTIDGSTLFAPLREKVGWNSDQIPEYGIIHKTGHDGGDFLFRRIKNN